MKNLFLKALSLLVITITVIFLSKEILSNKEKEINNQNSENIYNISNDATNKSNVDTSSFEEAYVKRVVDGDTIVVTIDNTDYKVRLIGVDTPESTTKVEPYGKEASSYTTSKLTGKTVYLEKDVSETDKYNRLLRYVWLEIPNEISEEEIKEKMFNAILLLDGYANVFTYPPDVKYVDYFKEFENVARENNLGLWGI